MMNRCLGCMAEKRSGEAVCPKCGYTDGTAPKEPLHIIPGTEIKNRYLIGTTLGFGGFGITYIAWDKTLKQKVAIKEYFPGDFATRMPGESRVTAFKGEMTQQYQAGLKRFMSEAQKLAKYGHVEGIVSIYDIFHENETAYIVMEYLEGQDVKSYLKDKGGKLTYDETMEIITTILKTLQIVHRDQLIHRDISPDNIFITKENKIKLLDFGAARYATTTHSKSLSVILKPGYAPEEQYRSKGIQGPWSDVYAVAATMYKMLTGMVPDEALERRVNDQLVEPAKMGVQMPANAEIALMNALVVKAEQRTGTAEAFLRELTGEETAERIIVKKEKEDKGKWPGWLKALVIASAVLMIAAPITLVLAKQFVIADHVMDITIPNVQNMSREEAKAAIEEAGMQYMEVDSEYNVFAEKDTVLSQDPKSGTMGSSDTVVEVVISAGPEYAIVPDMTYVETEQAVAELEELGFKTVVIEENSDTAPGVICAQSIAPFDSYVIGKKIVLSKSLGYENTIVGEECFVPSLVGMEIEKALELLKSNNLYLIKEYEVWNENVEAGAVLVQSPSDGFEYTTGEVVKVITSKGREKVIVPYLLNKPEIDAVFILEEMGFVVTVDRDYSETVQIGDVLYQSKEPNESVYIGQDNKITLTISEGASWSEWLDKLPEDVEANYGNYEIRTQSRNNLTEYKYRLKITSTYINEDVNDEIKSVPDLVGLSILQSFAITESSNLIYQVVNSEYNDEIFINRIVSQTPISGDLTTEIPLVEVIISSGNKYVLMPNLLYYDVSVAKLIVEGLGLEVAVETVESSYKKDIVLEQSINANDKVSLGSKITLSVSTGVSSKTSSSNNSAPNFIGMQIDDAVSSASELNINIVKIQEVWSDDIPEGQITVQSPTHNNELNSGDVIEVVVSAGKPKVLVPYVTYKSELEARDILEGLGFTIIIEKVFSDLVESGSVVEQSIEPNSVIYLSDEPSITLRISKGRRWSEWKHLVPTYVLENYELYEVSSIKEGDYIYLYSYRLNPYKKYLWSDWYLTLPEEVTNNPLKYEVRNKTQYRYIDSSREITYYGAYKFIGSERTVVLGWQDERAATSSNRREETREVYSYRLLSSQEDRDVASETNESSSIIVPDIIGKHSLDAYKLLVEQGLEVTAHLECSDTVVERHVISQSIEPGEYGYNQEDNEIVLTISVGKSIEYNTVSFSTKQSFYGDDRYMELWGLGIAEDGSVYSVGSNKYGQCDVSDWTDVISVHTGGMHSVGLRSDYTVVAAGSNSYGQCEVSEWEDIIAIYAFDEYTLGLKSDGNIVSTRGISGYSKEDIYWTDIERFSSDGRVGITYDGQAIYRYGERYDHSLYNNNIVDITGYTALREDASVIMKHYFADEGSEDFTSDNLRFSMIGGWENIICIQELSDFYIAGLMIDGTVNIRSDLVVLREAERWTDIKDILSVNYRRNNKTSSCLVGLDAQGKLLIVDEFGKLKEKVHDWDNIREIYCNNSTLYAITENGEVLVASGSETPNSSIEKWEDVYEITFNSNQYYYGLVIGIKRDGSLIITCKDPYFYIDTSINEYLSKWKVRIP